MSGDDRGPRGLLVAAVAARLRAAGAGTVFDAPPVRGGVPYAVVEEPVLADWSGVGWQGREGRLTVSLHDAGERPERLRAAAAAAEEALADMPDALGGGWRLLRLRLGKARLTRSGGDRWTAAAEYQVRMARLQ